METVGLTVRAVCSEWEERDQVQMRPRLPGCWVPCSRSHCSRASDLTLQEWPGSAGGCELALGSGPR